MALENVVSTPVDGVDSCLQVVAVALVEGVEGEGVRTTFPRT